MRGHVTRRASGKWAVVLDVGKDSVTDKRRQKWVSGFRTKDDADAHLTDLLGRRDRGEVIVEDKTPLAEYLTRWVTDREDELAPLSVTQYRSHIRNHIGPATIGSMEIGKIRRAQIRSFDAMLAKKGLAVATRNVVHAILSRALADAVEDDVIHSNASAAGLEAPGRASPASSRSGQIPSCAPCSTRSETIASRRSGGLPLQPALAVRSCLGSVGSTAISRAAR